jgi:N-acetylneuraminic acid mutarotase
MPHVTKALVLMGIGAALTACAAPGRELTEPDHPQVVDSRGPSLLASSNTWTSKHAITSPARFNHKAATINKIIYAVGGVGPTCCAPLSRVDAYDVATNTWSARHSMPSGRQAPNGASVINGKIHVTGGRNSSSALTRTLFVYNPGSNSWARGADMPDRGGCGSQGVIANLLYVYVGCDDRTPDASKFYRYNPATNGWSTLPSPPSQHDFGSGAVLGGKFYLVGGSANHQLDVYDPGTNSWSTRGQQLDVSSFMASGVLAGKLYLAGGFFADDAGNHTQAKLRVYDPSTNTWSTKAALPTPRSAAAGAVAGGLFFVVAGEEPSGATRKVVAYSP